MNDPSRPGMRPDARVPSYDRATLFGLVFFTHQVGGFFGAYLGGLAMARFGDYQWMWYTDIALASLAAVINLPIKEKSPKELMAAENN